MLLTCLQLISQRARNRNNGAKKGLSKFLAQLEEVAQNVSEIRSFRWGARMPTVVWDYVTLFEKYRQEILKIQTFTWSGFKNVNNLSTTSPFIKTCSISPWICGKLDFVSFERQYGTRIRRQSLRECYWQKASIARYTWTFYLFVIVCIMHILLYTSYILRHA